MSVCRLYLEWNCYHSSLLGATIGTLCITRLRMVHPIRCTTIYVEINLFAAPRKCQDAISPTLVFLYTCDKK